MKLTQIQFLRVAALYLGAACLNTSVPEDDGQRDNDWKLIGVNIDEKLFILGNDMTTITTDSIQLKLKSLKNITDEEFIQLMKIQLDTMGITKENIILKIYKRLDESIFGRAGGMAIGMEYKSGDFVGVSMGNETSAVPGAGAAHDFLRENFYALPYLGVNLFEEGIAVEAAVEMEIEEA